MNLFWFKKFVTLQKEYKCIGRHLHLYEIFRSSSIFCPNV
jgi:hypothetical protein